MTGQSSTAAKARLQRYVTEPVDFNSFAFEAPLAQPVEIVEVQALHCNLSDVPEECEDVVRIVCGNIDSVLSPALVTFLRAHRHGSNEDALHSRDDGLIEVRCLERLGFPANAVSNN